MCSGRAWVDVCERKSERECATELENLYTKHVSLRRRSENKRLDTTSSKETPDQLPNRAIFLAEIVIFELSYTKAFIQVLIVAGF